MIITLLGPESGSFLAELKAGNIAYEQRPGAPLGVPMNAEGDVIRILAEAIPWASIAAIMVAWLRARSSRKIIVTTKENEVIHAEGFSIEQVSELLQRAEDVCVIDVPSQEETTESEPPEMRVSTRRQLQQSDAEPENGTDG